MFESALQWQDASRSLLGNYDPTCHKEQAHQPQLESPEIQHATTKIWRRILSTEINKYFFFNREITSRYEHCGDTQEDNPTQSASWSRRGFQKEAPLELNLQGWVGSYPAEDRKLQIRGEVAETKHPVWNSTVILEKSAETAVTRKGRINPIKAWQFCL